MRRLWLLSLAVSIVLAGTARVGAAEGVEAIIDKAIKAHGGGEKLAKLPAFQSKAKGTLELLGGISFTQESAVQPPGQFKEVVQMDIMGQAVTVTTVFNKDKGWIKANDKEIEVTDQILAELKEAAHAMRVGGLVGLKEKGMELSALGEAKVNDRPAVGVRVSAKGFRDVSLYFDKETGLMAKVERRVHDEQSGQEVNEERFVSEYQDVGGRKLPKKVVIHRDGKKFMEAEVLEVKALEKLDDSEFAKP
jgi:hypothetical protein